MTTNFNYLRTAKKLEDAAAHETEAGREPPKGTNHPENVQNDVAPLLAYILRRADTEKRAADAFARIYAVADGKLQKT
jgi:hypothetical protein